jgi:ribosomal protein S18 acetylase RimI-like enzyme
MGACLSEDSSQVEGRATRYERTVVGARIKTTLSGSPWRHYDPAVDVRTACDISIVHSMAVMASWCGAHVSDDADALLVVGKGRFPTPFTNALFIKRDTDADALLDRADSVFSDRRYVGWFRGPRPELLARAEGRGHSAQTGNPGMVIEQKVAPPPASVDAALVRPDEFGDWVQVLAASYAELGLPPKVTPLLLGDAVRTLPTGVFAIARVGGVPAAAAVAITDVRSGVGGVYWVGTTPEARRRGAGDAVTRLVTNASFDAGASVVTLQASPAGAPVYTRMGYREVCWYDRFLSPPRQ